MKAHSRYHNKGDISGHTRHQKRGIISKVKYKRELGRKLETQYIKGDNEVANPKSWWIEATIDVDIWSYTKDYEFIYWHN